MDKEKEILLREVIIPEALVTLSQFFWDTDYMQVVMEGMPQNTGEKIVFKTEVFYIHYALMGSSAIGYRKFHDFFLCKKKRKDDFVATDFVPNYKARPLLTPNELEVFNKTVVHFTEFRRSQKNASIDTFELVHRFLHRFSEFIMESSKETDNHDLEGHLDFIDYLMNLYLTTLNQHYSHKTCERNAEIAPLTQHPST